MIKKIIITLFLLVGLLVRLYKIDQPIADWHSHRQADTSSVTRNFVNQGINIFLPTYHDLSDVQSGHPNPNGYRLVELPIYNAVSALTYKLTSSLVSIEITQRLINIILSLGSGLLLYLIAFKLSHNFVASLFTLVSFTFLPFNIYYSRTILPEPMAVFFMVFCLYFLVNQKLLFSAIALSLSILIKPYTALILFPIIAYYLIKKPKLAIFFIISLIPFVCWRIWISRFPEGIPVSNWLLNNSPKAIFPNWYQGFDLTFLNRIVAFRPSWFKWLFYERIGKLILASYGIIPLVLGLAYKKNQLPKINLFFILGILLYFIIVAQGNIQHDYYQILIIPFLSLLTGFGYYYLINYVFDNRYASSFLALVIFTFSTYFSWDQIKNYYVINNPIIIEAGKIVNQTLPQNAIVIAPYTGDTAFLYQTNRSGWPTEVYEVPSVKNLVSPRPLYLVSVNFDQYTNMMIQKYPTIYRTSNLVILNLN